MVLLLMGLQAEVFFERSRRTHRLGDRAELERRFNGRWFRAELRRVS
jgi:hypothetical protein